MRAGFGRFCAQRAARLGPIGTWRLASVVERASGGLGVAAMGLWLGTYAWVSAILWRSGPVEAWLGCVSRWPHLSAMGLLPWMCFCCVVMLVGLSLALAMAW